MRDVPTITPCDHRANFDLPGPAARAVVDPAMPLGPIRKPVRFLAQPHPSATTGEAKCAELDAGEILAPTLRHELRVELMDVLVVGTKDSVPKGIGVADSLDEPKGLAGQVEIMREGGIVAHDRLLKQPFHPLRQVTGAGPWRGHGQAREVLRRDLHRRT